ncbi:TMAO reductase system periplasmic protein TorT [Marinimicrococcus flavescens]|uniref:TMAO reductase system periplasmic protein TorT n=1 Tax=Marinimicrococcus flavescens TaxID=3031815 RepID=A0AAP3XRX5_9PROT|nr:TMAO reductase system periplasmic protein TorT [Marinimicrococcus flavescens]
MKRIALPAFTVLTLLLTAAPGASAQEGWPVYKVEGGERTEIVFETVAEASRKWKLCVLLPHVKDSYWVGINYGVVEEARRLGAAATIHQAGGYDKLPVQIAQYDDCLAANPDAIILAAVSEVGLSAKMEESMARGIPTVSFVNPIRDTEITSKIFVDFEGKGKATGDYMVELLGEEGGLVGVFPGPQGSGWAESFYEGFKQAIDGTKVTAAEPRFGDTGLMTQLRLVEDTLQSYPDIKGIWGAATAAEAAVGALQEAGLTDAYIVGHGENSQVINMVREGLIDGVGTETAVIQAKVAVNIAIRALEGQAFEPFYAPIPGVMTPHNAADFDLETIMAPEGFQPVFSVE